MIGGEARLAQNVQQLVSKGGDILLDLVDIVLRDAFSQLLFPLLVRYVALL